MMGNARVASVVVALAILTAAAVMYFSSHKEVQSTKGGYMGEKVVKTDEEWRQLLTPEQFQVTRQKGTESAWSGEYARNKEDGIYKCVCCGLDLFTSERKYESGTGWPSFDAPVNEQHVAEKEDRSMFRVRTEVVCARCDAHLGHVFNDGPPETTGLRYCMNSAALKFDPSEKMTGEAKPE